MEGNNFVEQERNRIEIATLFEDVDCRNSCKAKFVINVKMAAGGNLGTVDFKNTREYQEIDIPMAFKIFFTKDKDGLIKKGTKFLVEFTGANMNNYRIIGLYNAEPNLNFLYDYSEVNYKIKQLERRICVLELLHDIDPDKNELIGKETNVRGRYG